MKAMQKYNIRLGKPNTFHIPKASRVVHADCGPKRIPRIWVLTPDDEGELQERTFSAFSGESKIPNEDPDTTWMYRFSVNLENNLRTTVHIFEKTPSIGAIMSPHYEAEKQDESKSED